MKILVCGGRDFMDRVKVHEILKEYLHLKPNLTIIQGGQVSTDWKTGKKHGADYLAKKWAEANDVSCLEFKADWNKYGKPAGMIRNQQMLDEANPDLVIAFKGGNGTADMVRRSRKHDKEVREIL